MSIQGSASTRRAAVTAPPATPAYRAPVSSTGKVRQAPGGRLAQVWTTVVQCTRTGLGKSAAGARLALHSPGGRVSSVGGARPNTRLQPTRCARPRTAALACPRAQTQGCASSPCARSARLKRTVRPAPDVVRGPRARAEEVVLSADVPLTASAHGTRRLAQGCLMLGYETRLLAQESLLGALSLAQARPSSQPGLPRRRVPRSGAQSRAAYRASRSSRVGGRRAPGGAARWGAGRLKAWLRSLAPASRCQRCLGSHLGCSPV